MVAKKTLLPFLDLRTFSEEKFSERAAGGGILQLAKGLFRFTARRFPAFTAVFLLKNVYLPCILEWVFVQKKQINNIFWKGKRQ